MPGFYGLEKYGFTPTKKRNISSWSKDPYKNSVSYGRWHTSLAVSRGSPLNNHDAWSGRESARSMITKTAAATSNDEELGFEALRKYSLGTKKEPRITNSAKNCLAHIADVRQRNYSYLGSDVDVLKGYMSKNARAPTASPSISFGLKREPSTSEVGTPRKRLATLNSNSQSEQEEETEGEYSKYFHQSQESAKKPEAAPKSILNFPGSESLVGLTSRKYDTFRSKQESKKEDSTQSQKRISAMEVVWSAPSVRSGTTSEVGKGFEGAPLIRRLSDLAQDDFVFNPKYASFLGKLPQLRHVVVPENSLPIHRGNFSVASHVQKDISSENPVGIFDLRF